MSQIKEIEVKIEQNRQKIRDYENQLLDLEVSSSKKRLELVENLAALVRENQTHEKVAKLIAVEMKLKAKKLPRPTADCPENSPFTE